MKLKHLWAAALLLLLSAWDGRANPLGDPVFAPYRQRVDILVESELAAMAQEQQPSGFFPGRYGDETGTVSLVGMAYLAKGHLPGEGRFGTTINKCIDTVLASSTEVDSNCVLLTPSNSKGQMYSHGISTLFLSEVNGMVDARRQIVVQEVLPKALALILRAQAVKKDPKHQGGWRYKFYSNDSDLSVVGWSVLALRSAKVSGAPVPDRAVKSAVGYVKRCYSPEDRGFTYFAGSGRSGTLNGIGILCLELFGLHGHQNLYTAGDSILSHPNFGNAYATYYDSQAMFQLGGSYWQRYADKLYPYYLGSRGGTRLRVRSPYERALTLLALSVPYRQLPIYQRDETVALDTELPGNP